MEFTYQGIVRQGFGFYNPNHAAALICAVMPFVWLLAGRRQPHTPFRSGSFFLRAVAVMATAGLLVMLALTFSRTGVVVLGLQLLAFCWLSSRGRRGGARSRMPFLLAALVLALGVAVFGIVGVFARFGLDASALNRLAIWRAGLKLAAINPLHGVGVGRSGLLATLFLLPEGVVCRTLVNSHLTLLAECGCALGFAYLWGIGYALLNGICKPAAWVSFMGLCVSATVSSVFDWDVLSDVFGHGGLTRMNFILSHLSFALFAGLGVYLCWGRVGRFPLAVSGMAALVCVALPCLLGTGPRLPSVQGDWLVQAGDSPVLAYHDGKFDLRAVVGILEREGRGYRVSVKPSLGVDKSQTAPAQVVLFGDCAEFAALYGRSRALLVSPPEALDFPENTARLILRRYPRRPSLEHTARERGIPVEYY